MFFQGFYTGTLVQKICLENWGVLLEHYRKCVLSYS